MASLEARIRLENRLNEMFGKPGTNRSISPLFSLVTNGNGVGSQLWKLLSELGVSHTPNCSCLEWAKRMNDWGSVGCRLARQEIVNHLKSSAKNYGWKDISKAATRLLVSGLGWKLDLLDIYGSLLDEAIYRTENARPL